MMGGLSREADTSISSESQPLQESLLPQKPKVLSSLADMARKVIIQRIHLYDTLGDAPYQLVRPILEQCPPRKLCSFEEESPVRVTMDSLATYTNHNTPHSASLPRYWPNMETKLST